MRRFDSLLQSMAAAIFVAISLAFTPAIQAQQSLTPSAVSVEAETATDSGMAAMQAAARDGKYLFMYFWKQDDQQTQAMQNVLQSTVGKMSDTAEVVSLQITDPENSVTVSHFDVSRAPMPLVLAIAPNGAITGGLPVKFDEQQLRASIVSRGAADCLKSLQEQKLVLLNVKHESDANAFAGVRDFVQDERFAKASQIVSIDPGDKSEHAFLQSLKVDPASGKGVTVVLTPPGQPVATFAEDVTKEQIVEKLTSMTSSCCPDGQCAPGSQCSPDGTCCPGGSCAPVKK
ncbi:hypothetical protein [Mariniblastus fucicola]|uniref:Thioredoxin domain-containing protein n=1 Tax=Mariniblastus fucicola TaxID=980251 RepID=A0A5B9PJ49_9BACT|nr:hypothetical protein [Mariniblastus fucicola]QEG24676.1 hypothetical protein MFFC18_45970 [Mariniblastus fucicola]